MGVISYKCPNCGGELVFDPAGQNYKCEYCGSVISQEEFQAMERQAGRGTEHAGADRHRGTPSGTETSRGTERADAETAVVYHCPSCGAEIVTDSTTAASFCYYCHSPVVLSGRLSGKYLPDFVVPFSIDREQAERKFLDFVHSKKFIPKSFFSRQQLEKFSGVYFPYWVYECSMNGRMQAQGTNLRIWRSGDLEYTETKYYRIIREGEMECRNISKNALQKANQTLAQGVLPFDMRWKKEFQMGYLSGFFAEKRDVEQESLKEEIAKEVRQYGRQMLRDTISGYSGVSVENCDLRTLSEHWSYVLLPVWTMTCRGRNGKLYYFSMNGQNGAVYGELPVDYKKVGLLSFFVFLVVLLLFLAGGYLL